jgi:hypothetical protein
MRRLLPLALIAPVLLLAACGRTQKPFRASSTQSCLQSAGFKVSTNVSDDLIAATAPNGALRVTPAGGGNTLILSFSDNGKDATGLAGAYKQAAPPKLRPHIGDILSTKRNAVIKWTVAPTPDQQSTVLDCLRS